MNPLTTSALDLPGHLSAKAGPALIAGDELHFAAIAESLGQSIADLSGRLDAKRNAQGSFSWPPSIAWLEEKGAAAGSWPDDEER